MPRGKRLGWGYYAWSAGGQAFDVWTTMRFDVERHERKGVGRDRAVMWIVRRPALAYSVKIGVGLGAAATGDVIYRRGVRTKDRTLRIAGRAVPVLVGALGFVVGIQNERTVPRKATR